MRSNAIKPHWKYLNHQIEELGGVDRALFSDLPPDFKLDLKDEPTNCPVVQRLSATNLTARLEKLLVSTNYRSLLAWMTRSTASPRTNGN